VFRKDPRTGSLPVLIPLRGRGELPSKSDRVHAVRGKARGKRGEHPGLRAGAIAGKLMGDSYPEAGEVADNRQQPLSGQGAKKRRLRFARAVMPPEKFHTTKRGKRGYSRQRAREEEREAREA
jgi:hypothetical protein